MTRFSWLVLLLTIGSAAPAALGGSPVNSTKYKAVACPQPTVGSTWAIVKKDGANRDVDPYLSSLGQGESGTGTITSPSFVLDADTIQFTICGHDGPQGGGDKNFIALVEARKGDVLAKTNAPANDAMQERSWNVAEHKGKEVRIELRDGDPGTAFAWFGVGRIDAGAALNVDFRNGLPEGWSRPTQTVKVDNEVVVGAVPFLRNASVPGIIPASGAVDLPCGFRAKRVFFLGCTVPTGKPLTRYGVIEVHYVGGKVDIFHLTYGFTLEGQGKKLSPSPAMYLDKSLDPFQYLLAIAPADEPIEMIRLASNPARGPIPMISAVTCETQDTSDNLLSLPLEKPVATETAWIETHTITPTAPDRSKIADEIRKYYQLTTTETGTVLKFKVRQLDPVFRSEGLALNDFNGDGQTDIAAGNVCYTGPNWKLQPLVESPLEFPVKGYSDAFLCFDDDIDRDGAIDLVVVGFPGQKTHWMKNPGKAGGTWTKYLAVETTGNESPEYVDIDKDGVRELVFMQGDRCALARPAQDVTAPWTITVIANPGDPGPGHGLGVGDVNLDGRLDILIPNGWWEQPAEAATVPWVFHPAEFFGGAQLCVFDFDGDGDQDVLGSSAHAYGIAWTEQTPEGWKQHMIDETDSQTHAIHLADMNGDGLMDFVTGKRYWAHNGHDVGEYEPTVLCWYEMVRADGKVSWIKHLIHENSGVGLHFRIADMNGDKRPDIITANKKGVFIFEQLAK